MVPRKIHSQIQKNLDKFPAVAVLGPRQCGKTTLVRTFEGIYFDLESEGSDAKLDAQWNSLVSQHQLLIIDEAQRSPKVFSRLRSAIDDDRKRNGRFLLLGSVSPSLMKNVSESLAGRLGIVRMSPLGLTELANEPIDDLWLFGGYPDGGILKQEMFPDWQRNYIDALVTRDLPNWGLPSKPQQTTRLLHMLGAIHGQLLNASQLGSSLALDYKTILSYCDYLEGAFLIRRLPPYVSNIRKRLSRTPRIYWRDSGLLHALMGITNMEQLYRQPWLGASWEGFIIEQTITMLTAVGKHPQLFFFRTSDGYELDLVLDWGVERWAIEVKITSDPSPEMIHRLNKTADLIEARRRFLVCRIASPFENKELKVTHLPGWLETILE